MTLLIGRDDLAARRPVATAELSPLARSLADDLAPLVGRDPYVPDDKALLSRAGGRCPRDGTMLDFDPWLPHEHRCPSCGETHRGELHDRFWIYWYQLWLVERAVNAATLAALGAGDGFAAVARTILDAYADRYLRYPNRDNVLGPTRLFFSTYLESIWLLNVCIATDLLALAGDDTVTQHVIERIVEPSSAIIAVYDEGASNRQVWNAAALCAAGRLMDDARLTTDAVGGAHGVLYHLSHGLLADGSWYEGENYHLFAHRGLWYGVALAGHAGFELPESATRRFDEGFATPFLTALPDFTFPARRDSQFAVSLRQPRFAELAELGLARTADARLTAALARLYEDDIPRAGPGRSRSTADVERNGPATALSRADLGWRSLLFARATLPPLTGATMESVLLPAQGFAVVRRNAGSTYVALDYGHSGGGHGHPDRLNLLIADGRTRWLDDMGTGSYVDPSLHWYRSSLAHNAPFADGRSQRRVDGTLTAWEDRGAAGWVAASAPIADGTVADRTVVVMSDYALDIVSWESERRVTIDLPLHVDALLRRLALTEEQVAGVDGLEDGFRFVTDSAVASVAPGQPARLRANDGDAQLEATIVGPQGGELWRLVAPGPPGSDERAFWMLRCAASSGTWRVVWDWSGTVSDVAVDGDHVILRLRDGTEHRHWPTADGWHVDLLAGSARSSIDLGGLVAADVDDLPLAPAPDAAVAEPAPPIRLHRNQPVTRILGEPHYRRSEESWHDAGEPGASVTLRWDGERLAVTVVVPHSERTFVTGDAENPWDNEFADVNGDGVQLYLLDDHGGAGTMLVPVRGSDAVRVRAIEGWPNTASVAATWREAGDGYELTAVVMPVAARALRLDVVVNEKPAGRIRRRGQLVLSGAEGEFTYLRGDRHDRDRLLRVDVE